MPGWRRRRLTRRRVYGCRVARVSSCEPPWAAPTYPARVMPSELVRLTAREVVDLLLRRQVRPTELVAACLARIEEVEPSIRAMPTLCPERAERHALDIERGRRPSGVLGGLPIAVKDLTDVAGVRTTYGSPIYADHVPERSDLLVERLESAGAIVIGKSNTPEFGAGGNTFNDVFEDTRNPWDTSLTAGGSSGGSAAALAAGEVWLATGSDLAGSLRTPASFCGVVGIRPRLGRVPTGPQELPFDTLSVEGPMARNVADAALLLELMSGEDPSDPLSRSADSAFLVSALEASPPARLAFTADLGGITPVHPEVASVCAAAAARFAELGTEVQGGSPDLGEAPGAFQILRAVSYVAAHGLRYEAEPERLKADIRWNVERGLALSPGEIAEAERARGRLFHALASFLEGVDVLACPAACVPPFPVERRWVEEVEGVRFDNYVEWLRITSAITLTGFPAIVVPAGLTEDGRPVGLQLVGRSEASVLSAAASFEALSGAAREVPRDPAPAR
jgi:amidase